MVLNLMTGYSHLIAPIASDWLMGANFAMLFDLAEMIAGAAAIGTIDECLFTSFEHMLFHLVKFDLSLHAAVGASEHGFVEDGSDNKMKIALLAQLTVARVTSVPSFRMPGRFCKSTIDACQTPT